MKLLQHKIVLVLLLILTGGLSLALTQREPASEPLPDKVSVPQQTVAKASSYTLQKPQGSVILTVSGDAKQSNSVEGAQFDLAMLLALPQQQIETQTPWTKGLSRFEGPTLDSLFSAIGVTGNQVESIALNGYKITIPMDDVTELQPILALKMNDRVLSVREKGPSWIIYPWTAKPELQNKTYYTRSIWQLKAFNIIE
ncbi:MAG: hypothetical protein ACPG4U_13370 [Pseudomonadales bacterium]